MMPAAKHLDPVIGVDIHIIQPPGPVPPVPIPHPHISLVFDLFDYIPVLGATVLINGLPRAIAGSAGQAVPHIPIGGTFLQPPGNEDEMFMGSATVSMDGDAASYLALPNISCQDVGAPPPPRTNPKKKSKTNSMVLPTSVVLPIAAGLPVVIGGPPTISLAALGGRALFAGLGRLARSGLARRLAARFRRLRQRLFRNLRPGFLKCVILRAEPVDIVTGEVVVEQQDFAIPGQIPIEWNRHYRSQAPRRGLCGQGWESPADVRLVLEKDGTVSFYDGGPGATFFERLPEPEEPVMEPVDGAMLYHAGRYYRVQLKSGLSYFFFSARKEERELPVAFLRDPAGNEITYARDENGLKAIVESSGRRIDVVSRDGLIREMWLRRPESAERRLLIRYEYNAQGDLVAVYDALNVPYRFDYREHFLVCHTDRRGLSFSYEYDRDDTGGRCIHSWGDEGLYDYRFRFLDEERRTEITDSLGNVSNVYYDRYNQLIREIDPLGGETFYQYDVAGRTSAVVDPAGHRTEYVYDDRGNLIKLIRPDGRTVVSDFNEQNKAVAITDPNGALWRQEWDERGLLVEQVSPLGATSRYRYDIAGRLIRFTNPLGAETALGYDRDGNLSHLTDALGHTTEFSYDLLGNVIRKVDPLDHTTSYDYDAKGRLIGARLPGGASIRCEYDRQDNLVRYLDENGAETRLDYFGQGEIQRRIQPDGHTVEYHYDTEERLIGVTNQRGERYELKRDPLGRIIEEIDYWGQSKRYAYTPSGHLKESIDPLGRIISYETDPLGRISKKRLIDSQREKTEAETFAYDGNGNLIAAQNPQTKIERRFDAEGRLVEEKQGKSFTIQNRYDLNGNRIERRILLKGHESMANQTVRYGYDLLDQAISVQIREEEPIRIERNALGQVKTEHLAPQLRRELAYSPDGYLTAQKVMRESLPLFDIGYRYDRTGNLIEKRDSEYGTDRYTYDPIGRIIDHIDPQNRIKRYLNDPAGDRLRTHVGGGSAWAREGVYENVFYRFDRAGNLVERRDAQSQRASTFKWDANQRMIESNTDGEMTRYAYDPLGRRVTKETGDRKTVFFWDGDALVGDQLVEKVDSKPVVRQIRQWVYYPQTFEPLAMVQTKGGEKGEKIYFYHNDPNGCPNRLLDRKGEEVWGAEYSAWGAVERLYANQVDNPIRLQGQYEDEETGLYYNRYRYYEPWTGQFISQDPIGMLAGENIYLHGPNVWKWIDPLGLSCKPTLSEAKRLMSRWSRGSFDTLSDSIRYHWARHIPDRDVWTYLRKAASFNKRGAVRRVLDDGAVRYTRRTGEFLIERGGKIVSYGIN